MKMSLPDRLLRAAGLSGAGRSPMASLSALTEQIQNGLGLHRHPGAPQPLAEEGTPAGAAALLARNAALLGQVPSFGLRGMPAGQRAEAGTLDKAIMISRQFTAEAGTRPYRLFVPESLPPSPGLLVMLHGCSQTPEDFAAGTRMNEVAGAKGLLVLYPEQTSRANLQRCWNWFNPADQKRDQGEPALIAGMTRAVMAEFQVDKRLVFLAGLSAGGAKAAIMGAAYPDLYAAIGVHSGLACGAAHDMPSAFAAMQGGKPGKGSLSLPTIIFHGDRDGTVNPLNADAVAAQLGALAAPSTEHGQVPGGLGYTRTVRRGAGGRALLEQWSVHGAGHAWSGGSSAGSFTEPKGPDASGEMLRFFLGG